MNNYIICRNFEGKFIIDRNGAAYAIMDYTVDIEETLARFLYSNPTPKDIINGFADSEEPVVEVETNVDGSSSNVDEQTVTDGYADIYEDEDF